MLKDQVEKKRVRGPSGRWMPAVLVSRLDILNEVLAMQKTARRTVTGLTALNTEYVGFLRARRVLEEKALERAHFNPPSIAFEVLDKDGEVLPATIWQAWYRDEATRFTYAERPFVLRIRPGQRALKGETAWEKEDGTLIKEEEATHLDATEREDFERQWGYDENLASYKRQILAKFRREDKEPLYEHMRDHPEIFEPYWKDLAAQGLDYKETLDEYYTKRRAESARLAAERDASTLPAATADAPERVRGVMTLQELRRILDGFGELPPEGAEDSDEGWQAFESRFLAANGPEAKGPLRAALSIVRRELGATVTSDAA